MKRSLWARLLLANLVVLPLFLGATGLYLERSFGLSLDSAARERLQIQVLTLLAEIEVEEAPLAALGWRNGPWSHTHATRQRPPPHLYVCLLMLTLRLTVVRLLHDLGRAPMDNGWRGSHSDRGR